MKRFLLLCPLILLLTFCRSKKSVQDNTLEKPVEHTATSREIIPFVYFQFEKSQLSKQAMSSVTGNNIFIKNPLPFSDNLSPAGNSWKTGRGDAYRFITIDNDNSPARNKNITIEIAMKFDPDSMDKFEMGFVNGQFTISPGLISITTPDTSENKIQFLLDNDKMRGMNEYIYDGSWHHFAFRFSDDSISGGGILTLFVDGKTGSYWKRRIKSNALAGGNRFSIDFASNTHSTKNHIDELAIFLEALPDAQITKHSSNFFAGEHYDYSFSATDEKKYKTKSFELVPLVYDTLSFAPGFPEYSVSQNDQLKTFPLPRYKPGTSLHRNFPWFDLMYTAYDYSQMQTLPDKKFKYPGMKGEQHAELALEMNIEMYRHWNYYFSIPSPTFNTADIGNTKTIAGKQVEYANLHPEIQISTYTFWTGLRPDRAGYDSKKPYIRSNVNIDPCKGDTLYLNIRKDGITQRKNLEKLVRYLPARDSLKKIDFLCENGEIFGESHTPNAEGYRGSPLINCIQKNGATARRDRAKWQYTIFHAYSSQFIGNKDFPALKKTDFAFYQVAAFMPTYYSEFSQVRKINAKIRGDYYSTPDFYPGHVGWKMWETHGPYHGLDVIEQGRQAEIKGGDNYFSPFICAGWFQDTVNFRPAEWLSATKALAMMGAEFYYASYFNLSDPNKKKPMDPRGYIYQVAIPAYAQAITSRYEQIFLGSKDFIYQRNYNRITIYREDTLVRGRYAIHTSVYANSNYRDALQDSISNHVNIDGDILKINFRPQGSTYIYNKSNPANIIFYQLDAWQEKNHPYYWTKNFDFEAELYDDSISFLLKTERPPNAAAGDYTEFTTYVCFANEQSTKRSLTYHFEPRADTGVYYIWVRARSSSKNPDKNSSINVSIDGRTSFIINDIGKKEFQWYCVEVKGKPATVSAAPDVDHFIRIKALDQFVEIDRIILNTFPILVSGIEGLNKN